MSNVKAQSSNEIQNPNGKWWQEGHKMSDPNLPGSPALWGASH